MTGLWLRLPRFGPIGFLIVRAGQQLAKSEPRGLGIFLQGVVALEDLFSALVAPNSQISQQVSHVKAAHARRGARLLRPILTACGVARDNVDEACRLVTIHEVGGDPDADLLKDADSISYFDANLPLYYQREGWAETKRR